MPDALPESSPGASTSDYVCPERVSEWTRITDDYSSRDWKLSSREDAFVVYTKDRSVSIGRVAPNYTAWDKWSWGTTLQFECCVPTVDAQGTRWVHALSTPFIFPEAGEARKAVEAERCVVVKIDFKESFKENSIYAIRPAVEANDPFGRAKRFMWDKYYDRKKQDWTPKWSHAMKVGAGMITGKGTVPEGYVCPGLVDRLNWRHYSDKYMHTEEQYSQFPSSKEYRNWVYTKRWEAFWGHIEGQRGWVYPDLGPDKSRFHIKQTGTQLEGYWSRGTDLHSREIVTSDNGLRFECCKDATWEEEESSEDTESNVKETGKNGKKGYSQLPVSCEIGRAVGDIMIMIEGEYARQIFDRDAAGRTVKPGPTMTKVAEARLANKMTEFGVDDCSEACLSMDKEYNYFTLIGAFSKSNYLKVMHPDYEFPANVGPLKTYCYCHTSCSEKRAVEHIGIDKGKDNNWQSYVRHGVLDEVTVNVGYGDKDRDGDEVVVSVPDGYTCPSIVDRDNWIGGWSPYGYGSSDNMIFKEYQDRVDIQCLPKLCRYPNETTVTPPDIAKWLNDRMPEGCNRLDCPTEIFDFKLPYDRFSVIQSGTELRVKPIGSCGFESFGMMLSFKCVKSETVPGLLPTRVPWTENIMETQFSGTEAIGKYGSTWDPNNWMFLGCADHEGDFVGREYKGGPNNWGHFKDIFNSASGDYHNFVGISCQDGHCHENAHTFFFKEFDMTKLKTTGCKHGSGGHTCDKPGGLNCGNAHKKNQDGGGGWAVYADMTKFRDRGEFNTLPECLDVYYGPEKTSGFHPIGEWGPHENVCRRYKEQRLGYQLGHNPLGPDAFCDNAFATDRTASVNIVPGYKCPAYVDKNNWLGGYDYGDQFVVDQQGQNLKVYRDGCNVEQSWGLELGFKCCKVSPYEW